MDTRRPIDPRGGDWTTTCWQGTRGAEQRRARPERPGHEALTPAAANAHSTNVEQRHRTRRAPRLGHSCSRPARAPTLLQGSEPRSLGDRMSRAPALPPRVSAALAVVHRRGAGAIASPGIDRTLTRLQRHPLAPFAPCGGDSSRRLTRARRPRLRAGSGSRGRGHGQRRRRSRPRGRPRCARARRSRRRPDHFVSYGVTRVRRAHRLRRGARPRPRASGRR